MSGSGVAQPNSKLTLIIQSFLLPNALLRSRICTEMVSAVDRGMALSKCFTTTLINSSMQKALPWRNGTWAQANNDNTSIIRNSYIRVILHNVAIKGIATHVNTR